MDLDELVSLQSGVVSRAQLLAAGIGPHDVARLVRRRELTRVQTGVFADHTGPLTWIQRAWAACLAHGPAALAGPSALRAVLGPGWRGHRDDGPIHVAIDHSRRSANIADHRVRRVVGLDVLVLWSASPPRMHAEEAALDVALAKPGRLSRVALLSDLCQARVTTAARLLAALDARARVPDRAWLSGLIADLAEGTCSTLEHGFLTLVERPHRLLVPTARHLVSRRWAGYAATPTTPRCPSPSSSTGGSSTTTPPSAIATSTATSTWSPRAGVPCASAGARCSTARATPPPDSRPS